MGGAGPLPAVDRPLRDRPVCGADRGGDRARGRARNLWLGRKPAADVGHGRLHARHGDHRRVAGPGLGHRGRHGAGAEAEEIPRLHLQPAVRRRTERRLDLGGGDVRVPLEARQPDRHRRREQPAGGWRVLRRAGVRAAGGSLDGVRLAGGAGGRQRHPRLGRSVRPGAPRDGRQAAHRHLRHADGQGRAVPGGAREDAFHPRRCPTNGRWPWMLWKRGGPHEPDRDQTGGSPPRR